MRTGVLTCSLDESGRTSFQRPALIWCPSFHQCPSGFGSLSRCILAVKETDIDGATRWRAKQRKPNRGGGVCTAWFFPWGQAAHPFSMGRACSRGCPQHLFLRPWYPAWWWRRWCVGRLGPPPWLSSGHLNWPDRSWPVKQPKWDSSLLWWTARPCLWSETQCPAAGPPQGPLSCQANPPALGSELQRSAGRQQERWTPIAYISINYLIEAHNCYGVDRRKVISERSRSRIWNDVL